MPVAGVLFRDLATLEAMSMADWLKETDNFLLSNRRRVLEGKGKISHEDAVRKAEDIYAEFRIRQDELYISEFDRDMAKYLKGGKDDE